jgi:arylsulfatase A-like enzyme
MKHWRDRSRLTSGFGAVPLTLALALVANAPMMGGCSSVTPFQHNDEDFGSLELKLQVAPDVTLNSVTYTISGNEFEKSGTIDSSGATSISGTIGGIPAGDGYTITLTAKSEQNEAEFTGSAKFDVDAGQTSAVFVNLRGIGTVRNGSISVNGSVNVGPVIDELTVTPQSVYLGSAVSLSAVGRDPDESPAALSYYWSTTEGSIDSPISPNAKLTSATPGTATVKLTISDGDSTTTTSTTVTFVASEQEGGDAGAPDTGPERPNVLFIIVDDLGADSTSIYPEITGDSGAVPVPNIEGLAENGLVFDNAWASPVCSPTRGTILSGAYGHRTGVTTVGNVLPTTTVSLFDRLTSDSPTYDHAFFGKYHVGGGSIDPRPGQAFPAAPGILQHVRDLGITRFQGILGGGIADYFNWTTFDINAPSVANTTYATTALTDLAIDYIHEQETTRPGEPWFLYQAYNGPHAANGGNSPYQVPPAHLHSVDLSSVGNPAPGTSATNIPVYKANIQAVDTEVGRLLAEVDFENTVVIFLGDNGTPPPVKDTGSGLRGAKGSVYEGGVRAPLIVAGAGVTRRGREDDLFVTTDLYASILELAGVPVSQVNNSYSFKPLLSSATATNGRTHSFSEVSNGTAQRRYAVKDKRYKLVSNLQDKELYDLGTDPLETTNLYSSPAHAAALASLQDEIEVLRSQAPEYFP